MTVQEKLNLIEEALELDVNSLTEDKALADISEYDSMAKLTIIVLADDEFGTKLTGEQLRDFKTVGDIVAFLS